MIVPGVGLLGWAGVDQPFDAAGLGIETMAGSAISTYTGPALPLALLPQTRVPG